MQSRQGLPFILVTVENNQAKIIEAVQAGVTDYLIKPFHTYHQKITSSGDAK